MTQPDPNANIPPQPVWDGEGKDPWLPARLSALLDASTAEQLTHEAIWDALSAWLVETTRRIFTGPFIDPTAILAQAPAWQKYVAEFITGTIMPIMSWAYENIFGNDYKWQDRPNVIAYLISVSNRLVGIPEEVFGLVSGQIAAGVTLGEGIPELTQRVDAVLSTTKSARWPNRAAVIARTECLTGDAIVQSDGIKAVYRRWYQGDAFRVHMASGEEFTATANHPILTARGWVGAGDLMPGDDLLCHAGGQGLRASGNVDISRMPSSIAELYDALSAVGVVIRTQTRKPDFHGDGMNSYVDVATTDRELIDRLQGSEQGRHFVLKLADSGLTPLHASRHLLSVGGYASASHDSQRPKPSLYSVNADPKFLGKVSGTCTFGVSGCQGRYVNVNPSPPPFSEKIKLGTLSGTDIANRLPGVGEYGPDPLVADSERLRQSLDPLARPVGVDHILRIDRLDFSGHVYNLTTQRGWFGVGSHYSGNTMGALNGSRADSFQAFEEEGGEGMERMWLSTHDSRTRESHVIADGQRVGVTQPFIVGGFPLMFPGDPTGPPQETIQCRCSLLLLEIGENVNMTSRQLNRR